MSQHIWADALAEQYEKVQDWIDALEGDDDYKAVHDKLIEVRGPLASALQAAEQIENVPEGERY